MSGAGSVALVRRCSREKAVAISDGDPDGVRIIDRMNWTGRGIVFPRDHWPLVKTRPEMSGPGIYILSGPKPNSDDDLPLLYIGQADAVGKRLEAL
jgi:hypothetical protein